MKMIYVMFTNSSAKEIKKFVKLPFSEAYQLTLTLERDFHFQNRVEEVDFYILDDEDTELYKGTLILGSGYAESIYHHVIKKLDLLTVDEQESVIVEQKQAFIDLLKDEISTELNNKVKVVEKLISVTPQNIAFISLSKGAGSTFHAVNFASFLIEQKFNVGLYENPTIEKGRTYLKDVFDMTKTSFASVPHFINDGVAVPVSKTFFYKKMAVYPIDYAQEEIDFFTISKMYQYLNTGKHTFKVFDLGYYDLEVNQQFLQMFDHIYVVVDLMPTSFLANYRRLEWLLEHQGQVEFPSVHYLLNPYIKACSKQELQELGLKEAYKCQAFMKEQVLIASFNRELFYFENEEAQQILRRLYHEICKDADIPILLDQKKGIFKKVNGLLAR